MSVFDFSPMNVILIAEKRQKMIVSNLNLNVKFITDVTDQESVSLIVNISFLFTNKQQ